MNKGIKEKIKDWEEEFDIWWDSHLIKIGGGVERGIAYQDTKSFIRQFLAQEREELEKFINKWERSIDLNRGTWMGEMERYFEGARAVIKDLKSSSKRDGERNKI